MWVEVLTDRTACSCTVRYVGAEIVVLDLRDKHTLFRPCRTRRSRGLAWRPPSLRAWSRVRDCSGSCCPGWQHLQASPPLRRRSWWCHLDRCSSRLWSPRSWRGTKSGRFSSVCSWILPPFSRGWIREHFEDHLHLVLYLIYKKLKAPTRGLYFYFFILGFFFFGAGKDFAIFKSMSGRFFNFDNSPSSTT